MKIEQQGWSPEGGWKLLGTAKSKNPNLVLVFAGRALLQDSAMLSSIKKMYPKADIIYASTAGEIFDNQVLDGTVSLAAVEFENTKLNLAKADVHKAEESFDVGVKLAKDLPKEGLVHVFIISDGLKVNGSQLSRGLSGALPKTVSVTGGLVGDGANFKETLVGLNEVPLSGRVVCIGFYGDKIKVGYGSQGGWDPFGPERVITRSEGSTVFEIDGKPALKLYKEYLGDKAKDLPGSGLLFPLSINLKTEKGEMEIVTTLLAVNEKDQSLTYAGDVPVGSVGRLMKANFERLIDGASGAASMSLKGGIGKNPELAILVSCIGRKLVLQERIEEEVEAVRAILGPKTAMLGFYSYGELCPTAPEEKQCLLHNQTMTITVFSE